MTAPEPPRKGLAKGLGKGLSALLGSHAPAPGLAPSPAAPRPPVALPVAQILPGRFQPRRVFDAEAIAALADSMRQQGVLQPILVRRMPGDATRYELIAGERRWRAAQAAQLHDIPAVVKDLSDREALEAALVENLQREDLSPLEEAGKSRAHIANTIRLLGLPAAVREMLARGDLDAGHARVLLGAPDPVGLARRIVAEGLTVRQAEALARAAKAQPVPRSKASGSVLRDADTRAMEKRLEQATGLAVALSHRRGGQSGKITFRYSNLDQFDALVARLTTALSS
jgi:ParB family chromosome partitioning protein